MMFAKLSKKSNLKDILVISLSNIGDVIVTCPVIDILRRDFPDAKISVIVGPKAVSLFQNNSFINAVHVFDKSRKGFEHLAWVKGLRQRSFDLIVDLRNSMIPFMLKARYRMWPEFFVDKNIHLITKHLRRFKSIYQFDKLSDKKYAIVVSDPDKRYVDGLLEKGDKKFVVVAPVAADSAKTWLKDRFAVVCNEFARKYNLGIVFVGTEEEGKVAQDIQKSLARPALNLCGQTNLTQLTEVVRRSTMALVNDSGVMHIASYYNVPTLALFGPTKPYRTGPWSSQSRYIWKNQDCAKCARPSLEELHQCMKNITVEDVLNAVTISSSGEVQFKK